MIALVVYNLLLALLSPLLTLFLLWRLGRGKEDRAHWSERWGRLPREVARDNRRPRFWVHAVSVGEVAAAAPVLRELRRRFPDAYLLLSTTTIGGRQVARERMPPADAVVYFPLDFPLVVRAALAAARPDALLLMEWEIWPNFLCEAKRRGAVVAVLNGRISDKGLRRGRKGAFFTRPGLVAVDLFAMQSDEDARRAVIVGANAARVHSFGNTKFDESVQSLTPDERFALRADLGIGGDAPVWVCGSTRPGEEEIIADAFKEVRNVLPNARLVVAPRHLDRADEVAAIFERAGFTARRRSQNGKVMANGVLLLDTFGELARVYAVADAAFVGGSLAPWGGQSVFQPLAQRVPAVFGPYMNNQRDIAALSIAENVGFSVTNAQELAREVTRLLQLSPNERDSVAERARGLIERNRGVTARCVEAVADLLAARRARI